MNEISSLGGIWSEHTLSEKSSGILLIENMTTVFALVEALCEKKEFSFLDISNNLKKHRETREFDLLFKRITFLFRSIGRLLCFRKKCWKWIYHHRAKA